MVIKIKNNWLNIIAVKISILSVVIYTGVIIEMRIFFFVKHDLLLTNYIRKLHVMKKKY